MKDAKTIRILIADDHTVVRDGLAAILGMRSDIRVVGQAADGEEACSMFKACKPDVMLLDLRMPKLDGVDVVRRILSEQPAARIVIVTTYNDDEDILRSLNAGAQGYLLKDSPRQQIVDAVRTVAAGERYIPAALASKAVQHALRPQLTLREVEVIQRISRGESNKAIGGVFLLSEGTVKAHVKSILAKLGATSRTGAVAIARERGLIRE